MEWLTKLLEGKLQEGDVAGVVESIGKELPLHFMPKHKFNEVNDAKKNLEDTLKQRDKQLVELQAIGGDAEKLKSTIEQLQTENKEAKTAYEAKIKDIQVSTAIENSLKEAKAKHPDLLLSKIDKSLVTVKEDGTISGLSEQLTTLQSSYADLFEVATQAPVKPAVQGFVPVNNTGSNKDANPLSDGAKLAQMFNQNSQSAPADPWKN